VPASHAAIRYGPVPTGWRTFASAAVDGCTISTKDRRSGRIGSGVSEVTTSVVGSGAAVSRESLKT
jgi:hypothetical protein